MKKSIVWIIVWAVLLQLFVGISMLNEVVYIIENGVRPEYQTFHPYRLFMLFFYVPFVMIPAISITLYFSIREKIKPIKIISTILLIHHMLFLIGAIIDTI